MFSLLKRQEDSQDFRPFVGDSVHAAIYIPQNIAEGKDKLRQLAISMAYLQDCGRPLPRTKNPKNNAHERLWRTDGIERGGVAEAN